MRSREPGVWVGGQEPGAACAQTRRPARLREGEPPRAPAASQEGSEERVRVSEHLGSPDLTGASTVLEK